MSGIIAPQRTVTSFGPPEGAEFVTQIGIDQTSGMIGGVEPLTFTATSIGAVADTAESRIKVSGKRRVISISSGNLAVTGTCSFYVRNETQSVNLCAAQTITTSGTTTTTTITNDVVQDGDVLAVYATAGTSISELLVSLATQALDVPPGLQS